MQKELEYVIIDSNDKEYPQRLKEIANYPKKLYAMGNIELLNKASISMVGSRDADEYGIEQAKRFAAYLSQKGICIVSGLARGIDSISHINSKNEIGKTIAVIASGFKHIYPPENKNLFYEIVDEGGLIISEWEPDVGIDMGKFPRRNRIISGISLGTILVESAYRSGNLVTSPRDILSYYEYSDIEEFANEGKYKAKVDAKYIDVYNEIGDLEISPNEIALNLGKSIRDVNETLFVLEMDGFIERRGIGKFIRKRENEWLWKTYIRKQWRKNSKWIFRKNSYYEIIKRNFRCKQGEIDIIAYDNKNREYVFVEVKTRTNFEYGKPVDSVNKMKQKHIVSATKYYIYLHNLENKYIRFDIIEIYKKDQYIINHIKNVEINQ